MNGREVFVPQSYEQGQEGQVDWFEAVVKLDGELPHALQFFAMRSMASGDEGFTGPIPMPHSRLSSKLMNTASVTSAVYSGPFATTT